jgi:hypothetical protein
MADQMSASLTDAVPPREMIKDLRQLAEIPLDKLNELREKISKQTGFLHFAELSALINSCIDSETARHAVLHSVQLLRPEFVEHVLEAVNRWRSIDEKGFDEFPDAMIERLGLNLRALIHSYPAIDRAKKANVLRSALGNELKGAVFICDARPVFDEPRESIEGLIPLTTLKMVYERQDQSTAEIEIVLTASQLSILGDQVQKAKQKLRELQSRIEGWIPGGCVEESAE